MIDDVDSEQLFAVAKTPVAHIQPRAFEEGVERFAILWIHAAAGVACLQVSAIKRVMLVAELAFDRDLQIGIAVETATLTTIGAELVDIEPHRYAARAVATQGARGRIPAAPTAEFTQPVGMRAAQA